MNNQQLVDEFFNIHRLSIVLGRGGQGVVYRTTDADIAVKLLTDENGEPIEDAELQSKYQQLLLNIRLLPIPTDLNLSMPIARVKDKAGYFMPLLDEMIPLASLLSDWHQINNIEAHQSPDWLKHAPQDSAKLLLHYSRTGALRRRLLLLSKCAAVLARLHGLGLVYGDVSPQNIFVSRDVAYNEVWFIDADNLKFETPNSRFAVYTPGYGAPEVVQGVDGARPCSDCYAFAVLAFKLLSTVHPFEGERWQNQDGDWANQDDDIDDQAYAGLLPWIDDCDDDSNQNPGGIPRELLLTERLKTLFDQTFGAGRLSPKQRPCIFHWPQALAQAADRCIECPSCNMSYMFDIQTDNCPYCHCKKPSFLLCTAYDLTDDEHHWAQCWDFVCEVSLGDAIALPHRLFCDFSLSKADNVVMNLGLSNDDVHIRRKEPFEHNIKVALSGQGDELFEAMALEVELPVESLSKGLWFAVQSERPRVVRCCLQGAN